MLDKEYRLSDALICWECDNAKSMEDCKAQKRARKCNSNEKSCQQEIRTWGPGGKYKSITQRCKQRHACVNNHIQNPRAAWKNSQCQPIRHPENSVCRCCCTHNYCNGKEYAGCKGQEFMEPAKTTLAPTSIQDIIGGGDNYGDLPNDNNSVNPNESDESGIGVIDFNGQSGTGDEDDKDDSPSQDESGRDQAVTTVAPDTESTDDTEDANDPSNQGPSSDENTGPNEPGFGIMIPGNGPEEPSCSWADWTEWDKCSETCGGGQRNRYRAPIGGNINDAGCEGLSEEVNHYRGRTLVDRKSANLGTCHFGAKLSMKTNLHPIRSSTATLETVKINSATIIILTFVSWCTSRTLHQIGNWVVFDAF